MRKHTAVMSAATLSLLPLAWLTYFAVTYRCDLIRYRRLWMSGQTPAWLTAWELAMTMAAALVALMILPKIWRLWRTSRPLTRGEWLTLVLTPVVLVIAIRVAPAAMVDPDAQLKAFMGQRVDQCLH